MSRRAYPANPPCRNSRHQGVRQHVRGDDRASGDKAILAKRMTTDDCRIGANCGTPFDKRWSELRLSVDLGARIADIREDRAWSAEHAILKLNALIEADVVLDFAMVANPDMRTDHHILADRAVFADLGPGEDVDEMPDLGPRTDAYRLVHICAFVHEYAVKPGSHRGTFRHP